ncbi:hypothetical protein J7L05_05575 [bacterium]|nr:hypothetical protein [bacterium]
MSYTRSLVIIAFVAMIALILGCSGGGNPIAPDKSPESLDSVPIIGLTDTNDTFNAIGLMGAYELYINPDDLSAELVNKRVSSIGEDYIVSGIAFFTVAPCADCLKIAGIGLVGGNLQLTFSISHPFKPGITSDPPTASNRNDLDVFDVAMVIFPGGDPAPTPTAYALTGADVYDGFCVGADGFTCELADVVGDDAALPYFLVIDDSTDEDPPVSTWNKFAMGTVDSSFDVVFDMSAGSLRFDMYLTMGYGFSARRPDRLTPKYYNPEFNRNAAWKVVVTPPCGVDPPAMGNTWQDNDSTTPFNVTVDVYDWQIGATVATATEFGDAASSEVFAASEPSLVSVEVPGMNATLPSATAADDPAATGMPDDPWVYTIGVANENLLVPGEYLGLVKVTDERAVLAPADGRDFLIDTDDGIVLDNYSMPEYATYQTFPATVVVGCGPITLDSLTGCPTATISNGTVINFVVAAHSDNGGDPVFYDVDTSYDVNDGFIADPLYPQNSTGIFDVEILDDPCVVGTHHFIAFQITDSCDPANILLTDVCDVEIGECASYQELVYDFASGCTTYACQGWSAGGCGLPNGDAWGRMKFCNNYGTRCTDMVGYYVATGGDGSSCTSFITDYLSHDWNITGPTTNLPAATDSAIEWDHCRANNGGSHLYLYISEAGCAGPWVQLYDQVGGDGCTNDTSIDLSSYSGSNIMFRFRHQDSGNYFSGGSCGQAGVLIDNIIVSGTFAGTLSDS